MIGVACLPCDMPFYSLDECSCGISIGTLAVAITATDFCGGVCRSRAVAVGGRLQFLPTCEPRLVLLSNMLLDTIHVGFDKDAARVVERALR